MGVLRTPEGGSLGVWAAGAGPRGLRRAVGGPRPQAPGSHADRFGARPTKLLPKVGPGDPVVGGRWKDRDVRRSRHVPL